MITAEKLAKRRCRDCFCVVEKDEGWYCDLDNMPCHEVNPCNEFEGDMGYLQHYEGGE